MNAISRFVGFIVSVASSVLEPVGSHHDNREDTRRYGGASDDARMDSSEEVVILEDGGRLIPSECR